MEALFLAYFTALTLAYVAQNLVAMRALWLHAQRRRGESVPWLHTGFEPPVSILAPAHDEEAVIVPAIRSLLALEYPDFEVIVVNDGSRDGTLDALVAAFDLRPFPEAHRVAIPTARVRSILRSPRVPQLRVVDKENGGKSDAVNAGLNAARHPIVVVMDSDSVLQRDSLFRVVRPFLERPETVACGGSVRIANGCTVGDGHLRR
jgi:cellulose synthase/poly-beta-1,6-N-acetylglucosamine synthase-like glycosyltransferase